jgi:hypothetical protein
MARIKIVEVVSPDVFAVEFSETEAIGSPLKRGHVMVEDFCEQYGMSRHSNLSWLVGEDHSGFPRDKITNVQAAHGRDEPVGYGEAGSW